MCVRARVFVGGGGGGSSGLSSIIQLHTCQSSEKGERAAHREEEKEKARGKVSNYNASTRGSGLWQRMKEQNRTKGQTNKSGGQRDSDRLSSSVT